MNLQLPYPWTCIGGVFYSKSLTMLPHKKKYQIDRINIEMVKALFTLYWYFISEEYLNLILSYILMS